MVCTPDRLLLSILPLELWLEVAENLQPNDYLALSHTCRQAREGLGPSISKKFRRGIRESNDWKCKCAKTLRQIMKAVGGSHICYCWLDIPAMIPIRTNDIACLQRFFNHGLSPSFCTRTNPNYTSFIGPSRPDPCTDFEDFQPWSLLSYAIYLGNLEMVGFLLSRGANVQGCYPSFHTIVYHHGQLTPLHYALMRKTSEGPKDHIGKIPNIDIVRKLLEYGADAQRLGPWGMRALPFTVRTFPEFLLIPFAKLLLAHGASVNDVYEHEKTILLGAINRTSSEEVVEFVEFLLQSGADPNAAPFDHSNTQHYQDTIAARTWTPALHSVISNDVQYQVQLLNLLLDHGADIDLPSPNGWTPLHHAVYHCNCQSATDPNCLTKLLLLRGASTAVYDYHGNSPVDIFTHLSSSTSNTCEFLWAVCNFLRTPIR